MNKTSSAQLTLVGFGVAAGLPMAVVAGVSSQQPLPTILVAAASLLSAVACVLVLARQQRLAGVILRQPDRQINCTKPAGLFESLVMESLSEFQRLQKEKEEATTRQAELQARHQVRLRESRVLQAAFERMELPAVVTDSHDRVLYCNAAGAQLLRVEAPVETHAVGLAIENAPEIKSLIGQTRTLSAAADSRSIELDLAVTGGAAPYRVTAVNLYDRTVVVGVLVMFVNVKQERQQNARHAEFVSSVCHEFKTPIAGIKAYTELLMDGDVTDEGEKQDLYGFIDSQLDRLTRLVNNMLNLTRIESGVIKVQRDDCDLNTVLQRAMEVVKPTADDKQIEIIPELSELYMPVHVDRDLFGQGIINLLSNAVKYTPTGGQVRLRSRLDDTHAIIEVRDTGMGIPPASLPRLFERFYRVPENCQAAAGTGLGLALVKYIVTQLHGGEISVESKVGEGSCFSVRLPLGHIDSGRKRRREAALVTA